MSAQCELCAYQKTKAFNRKGREEWQRRTRRKPVFFSDGSLEGEDTGRSTISVGSRYCPAEVLARMMHRS